MITLNSNWHHYYRHLKDGDFRVAFTNTFILFGGGSKATHDWFKHVT